MPVGRPSLAGLKSALCEGQRRAGPQHFWMLGSAPVRPTRTGGRHAPAARGVQQLSSASREPALRRLHAGVSRATTRLRGFRRTGGRGTGRSVGFTPHCIRIFSNERRGGELTSEQTSLGDYGPG